MMKHLFPHIVLLILLSLSFAGCRHGKDTATTLMEAEGLMYTCPDSARQMLEALPHPERLTGREQADYALLLTQARSRCRITATSDSLVRIATDYYHHSDNHARKAKAFFYLGDVYMDMQKYPDAVKALKQAEEVVTDADTRVQSLVYANLGYLNRKIGNYKSAWTYYQRALDINKSIGHVEWIVSNLINILTLPLPEVQDSAVAYMTQLEEMLLSAPPDLQAKAYNNIGIHYRQCSQSERAAHYFEKAINTSVSVPYRAYLNLAQIYDAQGYEGRADSLFQAALQSPVWATRACTYEALYKRSLHAQRYQEATVYMKHYQLAVDSFYTHRQAKDMQELQAKYDYEVLLRAKTKVENRLLRIAVLTGFLLLLSIVVVFYFKKRHSRQLRELENLILQIEELGNEKKEMEHKEKEMESLLDTLNESLEHYKVLSNEFLRVKGKWTDSEDILALGVYIRLNRDLASYKSSSDLSMLGHWLDMVSSKFAFRLRERHQELTVSELSVCYLHRMGYSIAEISEAMHVKTDTVKRYIYRACTNMGIPQSQEEFAKYISRL